MVAYSFKARFIEPIRSLIKCQTIRAERQRHARPGEEMQLYYGMRTKQCTLIGRAVCQAVSPIRIGVEAEFIETGGKRFDWPMHRAMMNWLAMDDGFDSWPDMRAFWRLAHPDIAVFSGMLITWDGFAAGDQQPGVRRLTSAV